MYACTLYIHRSFVHTIYICMSQIILRLTQTRLVSGFRSGLSHCGPIYRRVKYVCMLLKHYWSIPGALLSEAENQECHFGDFASMNTDIF